MFYLTPAPLYSPTLKRLIFIPNSSNIFLKKNSLIPNPLTDIKPGGEIATKSETDDMK